MATNYEYEKEIARAFFDKYPNEVKCHRGNYKINNKIVPLHNSYLKNSISTDKYEVYSMATKGEEDHLIGEGILGRVKGCINPEKSLPKTVVKVQKLSNLLELRNAIKEAL